MSQVIAGELRKLAGQLEELESSDQLVTDSAKALRTFAESVEQGLGTSQLVTGQVRVN